MSESTQPSQGSRILFVLAGLVIVVWGIYAAQSVLLPFLVAIFLAVIGASPVMWLEKKRVPPVVAVLLVVAGMVGVLLVMAALVGTSVTAFSDALPLYQKRIGEMMALSLTWLSGMGIDISDKLLLKHVDPGAAMRLIGKRCVKVIASFVSVLTGCVLMKARYCRKIINSARPSVKK